MLITAARNLSSLQSIWHSPHWSCKWKEIPGWCVLCFCLFLYHHHMTGIKRTEPIASFNSFFHTDQWLCTSTPYPIMTGVSWAWSSHLVDDSCALDYNRARVSTEKEKLGKWRHKKVLRKILVYKKQRHFRRMVFAFQQFPQVTAACAVQLCKCCYVCEFICVV